jgi:hypothetical protein
MKEICKGREIGEAQDKGIYAGLDPTGRSDLHILKYLHLVHPELTGKIAKA